LALFNRPARQGLAGPYYMNFIPQKVTDLYYSYVIQM
jgi:hypothetical protein